MADARVDESYLARREEDDSPLRQELQQRGESPDPTPLPSRGVLGDIGVGLTEAPMQALGGVRDAVVEAGRAVESLADFVFSGTGLPKGPKLQVQLPKVGEAETTTAGLVRSTAQFLTGFVPFMRATRAVGITGLITRGAVAGAATDLTVFDPQSPRVANMLQQLAPALRNPVTDYLAAAPDDTDAEGRFKNALEGLALGGMADGLFRALRAIKLSGRASRVLDAEAAAAKALDDVPYPPMPESPRTLSGGAPTEAPPRRPTEPGAAPKGLEAGQADTFESIAERYRHEVNVQRRGQRTHAQAAAEAAESGMTLDDVRAIMPGTAMNDTQAVAVVKSLVDSGRSLKRLARGVVTGEPEALRGFLEQLYLHAQIDPKRLGVIAESGRTLSVMNEPVSGMNRFLRQFEELFQNATKGITPERLARMVDALETPEQMTVFARQLTKPAGIDYFIEAWINGLLSGPQTHVVNFLSNMGTALWAVPERALAARLAGDGVARGEATQLMVGMVGALQDAFQLAWHAMRTGESTFGGAKTEMRHRTITAENLNASGTMGRAVDLLGEVIRLPGRALIGGDEFFKIINYRGELRAHASREATSIAAGEGLQGTAKSKRVATLMHEILSDPPERIARDAQNLALYRTFTKELGDAGSAVQQALRSHPGLRIIMPFFRTPVNLAKYVFERTPLGLVADQPLLRALMPEMAANLRAGGARRQLALSQASLGSAVMGVFGTMAIGGLVTGGGPQKNRAQWLETHQPYSLKIGGTWISYNRLDPVGMIIGLAADASLAMAGMRDDDKDGLATALTLALAKNITSKTYLRGLVSAVNALADPERYSANVLRQFAGGLVPFSSLVSTAERATDPTLREARTMVDYVMSRIPGLSATLYPRVNRWGEDIVPGTTGWWVVDVLNPFYVKDVKEDPVADEIVRLRMTLGLAPEQLDGIELTDEQLYRFRRLDGKEVQIGGQSFKERLAGLIESDVYRRMTDEGRQARIAHWVDRYRTRARAQLLQEFPALRDTVEGERRRRRRIFDRSAEPSDAGVLSILPGTLGR